MKTVWNWPQFLVIPQAFLPHSLCLRQQFHEIFKFAALIMLYEVSCMEIFTVFSLPTLHAHAANIRIYSLDVAHSIVSPQFCQHSFYLWKRDSDIPAMDKNLDWKLLCFNIGKTTNTTFLLNCAPLTKK